MGPFIALRRRLTIGLTATTLLLAGCEKPCERQERNIPIAAPFDQFFSQLASCRNTTPPTLRASSSTGLTDSYLGSCLDNQNYTNISSTECEITGTERRAVYNSAFLYGFNFLTEVTMDAAGPLLRLHDQSANSATSELTYHFLSKQATLTSRGSDNRTVVSTQPPVVTELTNFTSGGRTYAQVWRLTNPLNAAQSRNTAVTVFYVAFDYGLIRFEQRDGTSWSLLL